MPRAPSPVCPCLGRKLPAVGVLPLCGASAHRTGPASDARDLALGFRALSLPPTLCYLSYCTNHEKGYFSVSTSGSDTSETEPPDCSQALTSSIPRPLLD
jgi:hypothetical protein